MNKSSIHNFSVLFYSIILVAIWVLSWIMGIIGLLSSGVQRSDSLLSATGVRWALRTAGESLQSAPWGVAVLSLVALGLLSGSGILETLYIIFTRKRLSHNRGRAAAVAATLLLLSVVLVFMCTVSPWHILSGVTGDFSSSPLAIGIMPLLFFVIFTVSIIHGGVLGAYRSVADVVDGVCDTFLIFMPAFLSIIPASGLLPTLAFVGVALTDGVYNAVSFVLYVLPFVAIFPSFVKIFSGASALDK